MALPEIGPVGPCMGARIVEIDNFAQQEPAKVRGPSRRSFLARLASLGLFGVLLAAYGSFASFIARFLYPAKPASEGWLFVRESLGWRPGESLLYTLPGGSPVHVRCRDGNGTTEDFSALSSTCPHLGCQVHWEARNSRFFCPCHNGIFTPEGLAIAGPPADAGQSLSQYPLKVEQGLLFIQVPLEQLVERPEPKRRKPNTPCFPADSPVRKA